VQEPEKDELNNVDVLGRLLSNAQTLEIAASIISILPEDYRELMNPELAKVRSGDAVFGGKHLNDMHRVRVRSLGFPESRYESAAGGRCSRCSTRSTRSLVERSSNSALRESPPWG